MPRNHLVDAKGRRRQELGPAGRLYAEIHAIWRPMMGKGEAAFAAEVVGQDIYAMSTNELDAALDKAALQWRALTEDEKSLSHQRAVDWEPHPYTQSLLALQRQRLTEKGIASLDRTIQETARIAYGDLRKIVEWDKGAVKLRSSSELSDDDAAMVAEVSEVLGKDGVRGVRVKMHSKPEALAVLMRYFAPQRVEHTGKDGAPIALTLADLAKVIDGTVVGRE